MQSQQPYYLLPQQTQQPQQPMMVYALPQQQYANFVNQQPQPQQAAVQIPMTTFSQPTQQPQQIYQQPQQIIQQQQPVQQQQSIQQQLQTPEGPSPIQSQAPQQPPQQQIIYVVQMPPQQQPQPVEQQQSTLSSMNWNTFLGNGYCSSYNSVDYWFCAIIGFEFAAAYIGTVWGLVFYALAMLCVVPVLFCGVLRNSMACLKFGVVAHFSWWAVSVFISFIFDFWFDLRMIIAMTVVFTGGVLNLLIVRNRSKGLESQQSNCSTRNTASLFAGFFSGSQIAFTLLAVFLGPFEWLYLGAAITSLVLFSLNNVTASLIATIANGIGAPFSFLLMETAYRYWYLSFTLTYIGMAVSQGLTVLSGLCNFIALRKAKLLATAASVDYSQALIQ